MSPPEKPRPVGPGYVTLNHTAKLFDPSLHPEVIEDVVRHAVTLKFRLRCFSLKVSSFS